MGMIKRKYRMLKEKAAGNFRRPSGAQPHSKRKETEESGLLAQIQEFLRVQGLVVMGNAEVDMAAQS